MVGNGDRGRFLSGGGRSVDRLPNGADDQRGRIEIGGMVDGFPEDDTISVYVHSNLDVQATPTTQYTLGSNSNHGRTWDKPWADLYWVERVLGSRMRHGKQIDIHLAGGMTEGSGLNPFTDPAGVRYYPMMDVDVGGGECFRPNVRMYGPRKMYRVLSGLDGLTCSAIANVGLSTRFTFTSSIGAAASFSYGRFLRVTDNATGAMVTGPVQIAVHEGTSSVLCDIGPYAASGIYATSGQTYAIVQPAVQIMNRGYNRLGGPNASPDGTWIHGQGAFEAGGYEAEANFLYNFNWISVERAHISGTGLSFNGCYFYTGDGQDCAIFRGGWAKLMGCATYGNVKWYCTSHALPFGTGTAVDALRGWAYDYDGAPYPSGDPRYPHRGPIALQIANGNLFVGANECDGNFSVPVGGLSVRCDSGATPGIIVNGQGSRFTQYANGTGLVTVGGHDGTNHPTVGLRVIGGGRAKIDDLNGLFVSHATTTALQLGVSGVNIPLGTGAGALREAAGYNGYAEYRNNSVLDCGNASG